MNNNPTGTVLQSVNTFRFLSFAQTEKVNVTSALWLNYAIILAKFLN